jgi:outer membrane biosynthesis protein TonB
LTIDVGRHSLKRADALAERPPGWTGYWSVRYGQVLARTLNLEPPFTRSQTEILGAIPRPLREALDPVASVAEPLNRDGKLVAWRLARSAILDLFGPVGLVIGALALAIAVFTTAVPRLGLPPLMAPAAAPQQPPAQPQPQTQQPPPQTQQQPAQSPPQTQRPPQAQSPPQTQQPPQAQSPPQTQQPPQAQSPPQTQQPPQAPPGQQKQQTRPPQAETPLEKRGQSRQQ